MTRINHEKLNRLRKPTEHTVDDFPSVGSVEDKRRVETAKGVIVRIKRTAVQTPAATTSRNVVASRCPNSWKQPTSSRRWVGFCSQCGRQVVCFKTHKRVGHAIR